MPKKVLIILVVLTILGVGGYFGWRVYQTQQAQKAAAEYAASSDKIADDLLRDLTTQNVDNAYAQLFSPNLQTGYSKNYWVKTFFPPFKDYKGQPVRHAKESALYTKNGAPAYNKDLNQQPTRYEYDFTLHDLTYRVTFVIFKLDGTWKVDQLEGAYLP